MTGPIFIAMALASAAAGGAPTPASTPTVTFAHNGLLESYCAEVSPAKPDPAVVAEIDARVGEFQAAWDREGPRWMAETVKLAGRPYPFHEALATLNGCPDMPTMTIPLVINVVGYTRAHLASPPPATHTAIFGAEPSAGPRRVRPMSEFVHGAWYVLTMQYVRAVRRAAPGGATPLMRKYAGESLIVRRQLHAMALDEMVSDRLGRRAQFDAWIAELRSRNTKDLVRAYEIVRAEGAERFVAELRP